MANLDALKEFANSNAGQSILTGLFGMLASKGQSNQANATAAANQQMSREQMQMLLQQSIMGDKQTRDLSLADQAPVGWEQQYTQKQLVNNLMLQKLLQPKQLWHPNEKVMERINAMPKAPQLTIPDEWQQVNPFGTQMTMEALAGRQGVLDLLSGGRGPGIDFTNMGINPEQAAALNQRTGGYRQYAGQQYNTSVNNAQQAMGGDQLSQSSGGGGSRLSSALSGAGTGATLGSLIPIPGVGPLAGGIIGGIGGLLFGGGKKPAVSQPATGGMRTQPMPMPVNPYTQGPWAQPMGQQPQPELVNNAITRPRRNTRQLGF